jgi:hypothetical protein
MINVKFREASLCQVQQYYIILKHVPSVYIHIVKYFLKARTVKPEKEPLLGNDCVTRNNVVTVGSVFSVRPVPRL